MLIQFLYFCFSNHFLPLLGTGRWTICSLVQFSDCYKIFRYELLGCVIEVCLHTGERAQRGNGGGGDPKSHPARRLPAPPQEPPAHRRPISPRPGEHRVPKAGGSPGEGLGERDSLSQQSPSPAARPWDPSRRIEGRSPSGRRGDAAWRVGRVTGCWGRAFGDRSGFATGR